MRWYRWNSHSVRALLKHANISGAALAREIGVTQRLTVSIWLKDGTDISPQNRKKLTQFAHKVFFPYERLFSRETGLPLSTVKTVTEEGNNEDGNKREGLDEGIQEDINDTRAIRGTPTE